MSDIDVKASLHEELRFVRAAVLSKLDGLSPYDVRRPLTASGINLLGLVKHLTAWEHQTRHGGHADILREQVDG